MKILLAYTIVTGETMGYIDACVNYNYSQDRTALFFREKRTFEPTTLCLLGSALYQLSYQGNSAVRGCITVMKSLDKIQCSYTSTWYEGV